MATPSPDAPIWTTPGAQPPFLPGPLPKLAPASPWAGDFGASYAARCVHDVEARFHELIKISNSTLLPVHMADVLEVGCGRGCTLAALARMGPWPDGVFGIEINADAVALARKLVPQARIYECNALDAHPYPEADLVVTCGFLVHVPPEHLPGVYARLAAAARRYLLLMEYHAPRPREIQYRDGVWCGARDFAGELLAAHPGWRCTATGFLWKRTTPFDDVTWFLLERRTQ